MNASADFFVSLQLRRCETMKGEAMINMSNHKDGGRPPPVEAPKPYAGLNRPSMVALNPYGGQN